MRHLRRRGFPLTAAPALATTVTTEPASNRTSISAILNGAIDTGGEATAWEFQWGTTTMDSQHTPIQQIPAGQGTTAVSWKLTNLRPATVYHFRLVASTGQGTVTYPINAIFGSDLTFTTKSTGRLVLVNTRLTVVKNFVSVPLRCLSGLACVGRLTISTRIRINKIKGFATMLCATPFYRIVKHKRATVIDRVRSGCLALLRTSPHQRLTAKLTSNPRTGQHALIKTVSLALG